MENLDENIEKKAIEGAQQEKSSPDNVRKTQDALSKFEDLLKKLMGKSKGWILTFSLFSLVVIVTTLALSYFLWIYAIPYIFAVATGNYWHWIWAWFVIMLLAISPFYIGWFSVFLIQLPLSVSVDKTVEEAFDPVRKAEAELFEDDEAQLLPLLKYSRSQLEAYYTIALKQTRRSFLYSVIAMWVGFIFIIAGISVYFIPVEEWGLVRPDRDMKIVVIAGGAIIEFVSALFLWVYRSTTQQLTYFYNRQIHTHNVILCFRIAASMTDSDEAKRSIVDKILDRKWDTSQPPPVGAKWISNLVS